MSPIIYQISAALVIHLLFLHVAGDGNDSDARQALISAGLPRGLLPQGVSSFKIDNSGQFIIHLGTNPCSVSIDNTFGLKYDPQLTGTLTQNKLAKVTGISIQVGNSVSEGVTEVVREGDEISFIASIYLTTEFPVKVFTGIRTCTED